MKDKITKIQYYISYFLRFTLVLAIIVEIFNQRWTLLFASSIVLILSFIPYFFEKKYKINLPIEFELVIILFIYASLYLGEKQAYYIKYWWWDAFLHTGSGMALGFAGFLILYLLLYRNVISAHPLWLAIFAFCFAMAIGAVWEIFEFGMDQIFGMNMQKSGLIDTMWDLIVDALGALLTSIIGYFYLRGNKSPLFTRLMKGFIKENPKMFKK